MASIFHNIRRDLLNGGRFRKYLIYAIGEIVLVVIGILIALQINNWNMKRNQKSLERKYLKETLANLELDLADIEFNIDFNKGKRNSSAIVLEHIQRKLPYGDSLDFHFANIHGSTRFIPHTSAYESLKSKGVEIIENDTIRRKMTSLYSGVYYNITSFEFEDDHRHQYEILWPELIKAVHVERVWEKAVPVDYEKLFDDVPFQNALTTNVFLRNLMVSKYMEQKEEVQELVLLITEELKK